MTDDPSNTPARMAAHALPRTRELYGPLELDPGLCPDGVVIRCYAVPTGRLLMERRCDVHTPLTVDDIEADAEAADRDMDPATEAGTVLVAYDGDTGDRMVWPT